MSELKWNWAYAPYLDPPEDQKESAQNAGYIKVVSKDEADKVIAHANYKRCLAMARWCHSMWILLRDENETKKSVFYWRWWNIWYELAEKFKEGV